MASQGVDARWCQGEFPVQAWTALQIDLELGRECEAGEVVEVSPLLVTARRGGMLEAFPSAVFLFKILMPIRHDRG